MKQIHSNSQTSKILFQSPTAAEQRPSRRAVILFNLKEFALFITLAFVCWLVITLVIAAFGG